MKLATRTVVTHIGAPFHCAASPFVMSDASFVKVQNCDKERGRIIAIEQPIPIRLEHNSIPYRSRQFQ